VPRDFRLQVLHGSVSPKAPDYTIRAILNLFENLQIFAAQGAPLVSLTPVANGKNLLSERLSLFLLDTFG
jgi:hypothetical protein